jgi:hypothetical protein
MGSLRDRARAQALQERIDALRDLEKRLAEQDTSTMLLGAVRELLMEAEAELESGLSG